MTDLHDDHPRDLQDHLATPQQRKPSRILWFIIGAFCTLLVVWAGYGLLRNPVASGYASNIHADYRFMFGDEVEALLGHAGGPLRRDHLYAVGTIRNAGGSMAWVTLRIGYKDGSGVGCLRARVQINMLAPNSEEPFLVKLENAADDRSAVRSYRPYFQIERLLIKMKGRRVRYLRTTVPEMVRNSRPYDDWKWKNQDLVRYD